MSSAIHPSGEWVGYYTYYGKITKCPMHLTLNFIEGSVQGAGIDNPGAFVIEGSYDDNALQARWIKQYVGKHSVQYEGTCREGEIIGLWSLSKTTEGRTIHGEFRIWPLPVEDYADNEPLQSILEREIRRKG